MSEVAIIERERRAWFTLSADEHLGAVDATLCEDVNESSMPLGPLAMNVNVPKPSVLHQAHVAHLLRQVDDAEQFLFWRRLRESVHFADELPDSRRVPDAFVIDTKNHVVTVYEVEITGLLDSARIMEWADLWFTFDTYSWDLQLVTVDRFGVYEPRPLVNVFYASLGMPEAGYVKG